MCYSMFEMQLEHCILLMLLACALHRVKIESYICLVLLLDVHICMC